jgi:hypothetical protein
MAAEPRAPQPAVYSLLLPSAWMMLTWLSTAADNGGAQDVLFWFGVVVTLIGFPAMAAVVVLVIVPGSESVRRSRDVTVSIGVIAIIGVLSYVLGTQHPRLLTCEEFTISGNDRPAGCATKALGVLPENASAAAMAAATTSTTAVVAPVPVRMPDVPVNVARMRAFTAISTPATAARHRVGAIWAARKTQAT